MPLNVTILEACRTPEARKPESEAEALSKYFNEIAVDYVLYSNDGIWPHRVDITRDLIQRRLGQPTVDVVHLAMHGFPQGLALRWSEDPHPNRVVADLLPGEEIAAMAGWNGRLIVSGACESAHIADSFLAAGARGVVAPETTIKWKNLGSFFRVFYAELAGGASAAEALASGVLAYPEYDTFLYSEGA